MMQLHLPFASDGSRWAAASIARMATTGETGIVDPNQGGSVALENAVSVAGTLLPTEAPMTELPEAQPARVALSMV